MTQVCKKCGIEKPLECFHKAEDCKLGVKSSCKSCGQEYDRQRLHKQSDYTRRSKLLYRYGITVEEYETQLKKQGGTCALCPRTTSTYVDGRARRLHVDHSHDHKHDKKNQCACPYCIRGLLCDHCNLTLALLERCPHLQNEIAKQYLGQRPFKRVAESGIVDRNRTGS